MNRLSIRFSGAIALLCLGCNNAAAQSFNDYNSDPRQLYRQQLAPINREGFGYVNRLGQGVDDQGYYRRPIPSDEAFGSRLNDGWHEAPMQWSDQDSSVLYEVRDGNIIRQDYRLRRDRY
jgi:hypothetical protein